MIGTWMPTMTAKTANSRISQGTIRFAAVTPGRDQVVGNEQQRDRHGHPEQHAEAELHHRASGRGRIRERRGRIRQRGHTQEPSREWPPPTKRGAPSSAMLAASSGSGDHHRHRPGPAEAVEHHGSQEADQAGSGVVRQRVQRGGLRSGRRHPLAGPGRGDRVCDEEAERRDDQPGEHAPQRRQPGSAPRRPPSRNRRRPGPPCGRTGRPSGRPRTTRRCRPGRSGTAG